MSKKLKIAIVISFFFIFLFLGSVLFIKKARENRSWPFNSSLSHILPKSFKYYAYKFTNPKKNKLTTHYYDIENKYFSIPSNEAVGNGGGINLIKENIVLVTLDNGELILFDKEKEQFHKLKNTELKKKYMSIRDLSYKDNELLIVGIIDEENECKSIVLDIFDFEYFSKKNIKLSYNKRAWKSEKLCDDPLNNNAGGRVIKHNQKYYVSTGFFSQNINSGIYPYPQNLESSFGKIIEIDEDNNDKIFSSGHRNPQGLFLFNNKLIFATEHGPRGGDELNLIEKNGNYGWPCKTLGTLYSYNNEGDEKKIWPKKLDKFGCKDNLEFKDPVFTWTPSIAISQGFQYTGDHFKKFKNNIIVGTLGGLSIFRLVFHKDRRIINSERININERIRDIMEMNGGEILVYSDGGSLILLSKILN